MSGRALVTGATGMLGAYIVDELLAEGWAVRAFVRDPSRAEFLADRSVELAPGSLDDAPSLTSGARGCDAVFHAAAAIGAGGDWESFRRGNVEGTANVIEAARGVGARLVHVSSTAVFGRARYGARPTDEFVALPELPEHNVYGRSKQEAERIVLDAGRSGRAWVAVVRPPVMYGIRDRQFVPRVGPVFRRGVFPLIGGGRTTLTLVHAGSVAQGAVRAAVTDEAEGRIYHLTNDFPVDVETLVSCARSGLGVEVRAPRLPLAVGKTGFAVLATGLRLIGRSDLARHARGTLEMLTRDNPFCSERAREELGWAPRVPPRTGLTEAFRWWADRASQGEEG